MTDPAFPSTANADAPAWRTVRSELILGGQKSGKSRRAELLAREWLAQAPQHRALLLATGQALDDEMCARIRRHQADRALRAPGLQTQDVPLALAQAIEQHSHVHTLLVVDCLTLWLTNHLMPVAGAPVAPAPAVAPVWTELDEGRAPTPALLKALTHARGPVVLVSNEIGLGVIPLGREVRAFVDALGQLNQAVAQACSRVTLMSAGLALTLKDVA